MMNVPDFSITGAVEIFPMENPWIYVGLSKEWTPKLSPFANRGVIPIEATIGKTTWKTSLLPKGDGTFFLPLKRPVRDAEQLTVGSIVTASVHLRV